MDWKPYPRDRVFAEHPSGFVVIKPADDDKPVPLSCPLCTALMRSRDDDVAFREFECCNRCAMHWAHPRRKQWKEGWRPSPEQVVEYEAERLPLRATLDID